MIMILPRASINLLLRLTRMFIDPKNRRVAIIILATFALMVLSRLLVSQANRKRLQQQFKGIFKRNKSFYTGFQREDSMGHEEMWDIERRLH